MAEAGGKSRTSTKSNVPGQTIHRQQNYTRRVREVDRTANRLPPPHFGAGISARIRLIIRSFPSLAAGVSGVIMQNDASPVYASFGISSRIETALLTLEGA